MSTVNETIEKMIYNWPTLYTTRLDALQRALTESWPSWNEDGTPKLETGMDNERPYDETDPKYVKRPSELLFARRENNTFDFVRANAALIAVEKYGSFSGRPSFSTRDLNQLPLTTMRQDWREALVEYCTAVLAFETPAMDELACVTEAKATATEFFARLAGDTSDADDVKRRKEKIAALRDEAATFGFILVEGTPEQMRGY